MKLKLGKIIMVSSLVSALIIIPIRASQTQLISPVSPVTVERSSQPTPISSVERPFHSPLSPIIVSPTPTPTRLIHIVQRGEYPLLIAQQYGISVTTLMATNHITDPTTLQIGQRLQIFVTPTLPAIEPPATVTSTPTLSPTRTITPAITPVETPDTVAELERQILRAVNLQRTAQGLSPYLFDAELAEVAQAHAQDMVMRGYFAHTTPEGITLRDRLKNHGLEPHWTGENIQRNTRPRDETTEEAISWFMNSTPHRKNILHQQYTHLGVGVVEEPPGWYTFVLVFARL